MDGILNIYKEAGYTSHDVVAKLRGILKQKKIGHTGTLDPEATGVLPVCIGKATKVCEFLSDRDKTYQTVCRLGVVTDTQDMTGNILEEHSLGDMTEKKIREVVSSFLGESFQIPPMYSALKVDGRKLYEFAREGKTIKRNPRKILISNLEILQVDLEEGTFMMEVTCSKGTYIRTLCDDIGQKLGVGAAMESLVRIRVGEFFVENALTLAKVEGLVKNDPEALLKNIYPIDALFAGYPKYQIIPKAQGKLQNGNVLGEDEIVPYQEKDQSVFQKFKERISGTFRILMYDTDGSFQAIYEKNEEEYTVVKMF